MVAGADRVSATRGVRRNEGEDRSSARERRQSSAVHGDMHGVDGVDAESDVLGAETSQ